MANGIHVPRLIADRLYQRELGALLAGMEGRDDAGNIDAAIAFRRRWGLPCPDVERDYYLVGLHRQRRHNKAMSPEVRGYSGMWLHERGYSTEKDTVFAPVAPKDEAE